MCELDRRRHSSSSHDRCARVLDRPDRHPDADARARSPASRSCAARCSADGGGDAAQAMLTTDTVRKEATAPAATRSSAAWLRAPRCSRRRWPRCSQSSPPTPAVDPGVLQQSLARAVRETFDCLSVDGCRSTNDTVIVLGQRPGGRGRARTRSRTRSPSVCGSLAEQMARDAEGATKFVRVRVVGRATQRGSAGRRPRGRQQPARAVLAQRRRRLLGPSALGARRERCVHRPRAGRHLLQRRHRLPRRHRLRARRGRARRAHGRPRRSSSAATCAWRTAKRPCSRPISRTHTSTRTAARRDRSRKLRRARPHRGREGDRPRRGAAVHPGVLGQDRRDQVRRPRDERCRSSPTSSRPTSCSCAWSG